MGDEISMPVYQVSIPRSREMDLANHFPKKRKISFGRNHADDSLRVAPKRNRQRDVWLGPGRSVDRAYIVFPRERFNEFRRFTLVG